MTSLQRFLVDESGATAIEYALIAALIAVAIIGAVQALGGNITTAFNQIGSTLSGAAGNM